MTRHPLAASALAALAIPLLVAACGQPGGAVPTIPPEGLSTPAMSATPEPTHPGPTYPPGCPTEQPAPMGADEVRVVTISTDKGDIVIRVEGAASPIATGNFVALAECGYYDGVVFHRIVPTFVIQGGDGQFGRSPDIVPDLIGSGGPPYEIKDEPVMVPYKRGVVAMAKTNAPDSASSQFFVFLDDTQAASLEPRYQVIGVVTDGMDTVDAIAAAADQEIPTNPVVMRSVTVTTP